VEPPQSSDDQRAAIPEPVTFMTKPKMAREMIAATLDAGVPCAYVLGEAVYGADSSRRFASSIR
jgi:SRSO17 transposase